MFNVDTEDADRPSDLPGWGDSGKGPNTSSMFSTLRYGPDKTGNYISFRALPQRENHYPLYPLLLVECGVISSFCDWIIYESKLDLSV